MTTKLNVITESAPSLRTDTKVSKTKTCLSMLNNVTKVVSHKGFEEYTGRQRNFRGYDFLRLGSRLSRLTRGFLTLYRAKDYYLIKEEKSLCKPCKPCINFLRSKFRSFVMMIQGLLLTHCIIAEVHS